MTIKKKKPAAKKTTRKKRAPKTKAAKKPEVIHPEEVKEEPPGWRDPKTGHFLPGNRFWAARSSYGRKPIFEKPKNLLEACLEYFEWNESNPLHEAKVVAYQGEAKLVNVPKMRAMTIGGLCIFLDISVRSWNDWRANKAAFLPIIEVVEEAIRNQKFTGASADLLNANIIARDLGLADKNIHTGDKDNPVSIKTSDSSTEDITKAIFSILQEAELKK